MYAMEEELFLLIPGLLSAIPSCLLGIAGYVLSALAIYVISRRRGLSKPWLAWIPVVNCWLLGSLSDQYQYVVRRENKSKRKILLALSIVMHLLSVLIFVQAAGAVTTVIFGSHHYQSGFTAEIWRPVMSILGLCLPLSGVAIAYAIIRYMALYDIYKSLDPNNCVLFLVLSVLFQITEPFFLFFNRNKDSGMPPRRPEPVYAEDKDYL